MNEIFLDTMDSVNNVAKGIGFKNGIDWAATAQKKGEISPLQFSNYNNCHNLRIRIAHGGARDVVVSQKTCQHAQEFLRNISRSSLAKSSKNVGLPDGGFRGAPYIKEFNWEGSDGRTYYFKFAIVHERNYMDDGHGGTYATGYFIHILEAPYYNYALERLHEFHIIRCNNENHICWNKVITTFEEANAVMYVWVKRYTTLIIEIAKNRNISEQNLLKIANKKHILPTGTFRFGKFRGNQRGSREYARKSEKEIYIYEDVYQAILNKLGTQKPELGGMLGWTEDQSVIDTFEFDVNARVNSVEYNPDIKYLNGIIQNEWAKKGIYLGGFVHSHPGDFGVLSTADVEYAVRIMAAFDMPYLFMPIVTSSYEYKTSFNPYIVFRNGRVEKCNLIISRVEKKRNHQTVSIDDVPFDPDLLAEIENGFDVMEQKYKKDSEKQKQDKTDATGSGDEIFSRIQSVIDINYMSDCTIIGIGCGGARAFYEDMARVGVGKFCLIDGDISSKSNIASQNGYISEIGFPKPEVVKKRILDINNKVDVKAINHMFDDKMSDEQIDEIFGQLDCKKTLLCAFTDDFFAQAKAAAISQKYGIPYLSAQHHKNGETSEIIYWYPGISKYSSKEILKDRYAAYSSGYKNDVTSDGSPIFNTTRLNALCSKIATGILMYGANEDCEYSSFLKFKSENNLLIIRQKNLLFSNSPLRDLFEETDQLFFDDVLWINPEDL